MKFPPRGTLLLSGLLFCGVLVSCGGGGSSTPETTPSTNNNPTVNVSGDTSVDEHNYVSLTANATDSDGSISSILWSVSANSSGVTLEGAETENVSFQAPSVNSDTIIILDLVVTDNEGAKTTQQVSVTILSTQTTLTFSGLVTDSIIENAEVEIIVGDDMFTAIADENGVYSITITVDDSDINELVRIRALGNSAINPEVEFISQLSTIASFLEQVGDNGIISNEQDFGVNVTNVTTAEYSLLTRNGALPITDEELSNSINSLDNEEKNLLAALIKIIVDDDNYELPSGINSTLDLVNNSVATNAFHQNVLSQDPTLVSETISSIVNDNSLSKDSGIVGTWSVGSEVITFMRSGHYAHITTETEDGGCNQIGYEIGTYSWNPDSNRLSFTTREDSNGCSGLFDEDSGQLINSLTLHEGLFTTTEDTLTVNENGEIFTGTRLQSSNPFVGGYYLESTNFSDNLSMLITLDDNRSVLLYHLESSGLPSDISYLYMARDYTYNQQTATRIVHSQQVYVDGNITSESTEEVWRANVTIHGDVISMTNENGTSFLKNSVTDITQGNLSNEDVIGNRNGTIGDDFAFNATFNDDGTGQMNDLLIPEWEIVFGQLLLIQYDGSSQIWSPNIIEGNFNVTQYNNAGVIETTQIGTLSSSNIVTSPPSQSTDSSIVGTWSIDSLTILTFTNTGHYVHIRNGDDSDCGQAGYEVGSYSWNETTGVVNINTRVDTNGCVGLHDEQTLNETFELGSTIFVDGDTLQGTEIASGETFNFNRVIDPTDPLVGAYYEGDFDDEFGLSVFVNDSEFIEVLHFSNEQGLNSGTYNWNADSTLIDFGEIHINQLGDSYNQAVIKMQGDILIWKDDDEAGVMKRTQTTTEQPYFTETDIIGSFSGTEQGFSFTITFDANHTAQEVSDQGLASYTWRIEFGQLILDDGWILVVSPVDIFSEGVGVDTADFNLDANTDDGEAGTFEYSAASFWIKH